MQNVDHSHNILRYPYPEERILLNRYISVISVILRETTLTVSDSTGETVSDSTGETVSKESEIVRVVFLSTTEILR